MYDYAIHIHLSRQLVRLGHIDVIMQCVLYPQCPLKAGRRVRRGSSIIRGRIGLPRQGSGEPLEASTGCCCLCLDRRASRDPCTPVTSLHRVIGTTDLRSNLPKTPLGRPTEGGAARDTRHGLSAYAGLAVLTTVAQGDASIVMRLQPSSSQLELQATGSSRHVTQLPVSCVSPRDSHR